MAPFIWKLEKRWLERKTYHEKIIPIWNYSSAIIYVILLMIWKKKKEAVLFNISEEFSAKKWEIRNQNLMASYAMNVKSLRSICVPILTLVWWLHSKSNLKTLVNFRELFKIYRNIFFKGQTFLSFRRNLGTVKNMSWIALSDDEVDITLV